MASSVIPLIVFFVAVSLFYYCIGLRARFERVEKQLEWAKKDIEFYKELAEMWEEKYNDDQPVIIKSL